MCRSLSCNGPLSIDGKVLPEDDWTSQTSAEFPTAALLAFLFNGGGMQGDFKSHVNYVWPVRSGWSR